MKLEKINAFKANDGSIWEIEKEAIECNIDEIVNKLWDIAIEPSNSDIISWMRQNKKEIQYILKNI